MDLFDMDIDQNTYKEALSSSDKDDKVSHNHEDKINENKVELQSNKSINSIDVDIILLFLENPKLSGGGSIADYEIDTKNRKICVNYELNLYKQRVLAKRILKIQDYVFLANEPFDEIKYSPDKQVLILKNIPDKENKSFVQMYGESLVLADNELNDVESIGRSSFFENIYYIRFKFEFDLEKCKKRLERRPTLHECKVEILDAFQTNTIIFKRPINENESFSFENIESYFLNKKRFPESPLLTIRQKEPFLLLRFKDYKSCQDFLLTKQEIFKKVHSEHFYNFDLLNEEIEKHELRVLQLQNSKQSQAYSPNDALSVKKRFKSINQILFNSLLPATSKSIKN